MQKMSTKNTPEAKAQRRANKQYDAMGYPSFYVEIQKIGSHRTKLVGYDRAHRLTTPQLKVSKVGVFMVQPQWGMANA